MRLVLSACAGFLIAGVVPAAQPNISQGDPQRAVIARNNPGIAAELKLSAAEESRLFDLLNQHQTAQRELSTRIAQSQDQAARMDLIQQQVPLQRQLQDAIASLLGPARYSKWQEYEQTRQPRVQAANIAAVLARAGRPLSQKQQKSVVNALIADQKRARQDLATTVRERGMTAADLAGPDGGSRLRELSLASAEDSKRRVVAAVSPILDARQLTTLKDELAGRAPK